MYAIRSYYAAAMLEGMGRTGSKMEVGIMAAPPATIRTTMVSPMARDMPRMSYNFV